MTETPDQEFDMSGTEGVEATDEEQVSQKELEALDHVDQDVALENPYTADDFSGEQEDTEALDETARELNS